jgi:hypothetical protein
MSRYGWIFQSIPLHIVYKFQHFEPIEYVNGLSWFSFIFQVIDSKVHIDLDDFPFFFGINVAKTSN